VKEFLMRRILLSVTAVVLALVMASPTMASPPGKGGSGGKGGFSGSKGSKGTSMSRGGKGFDRDYHRTHGTRFRHGFFYRGRHHNHWSYRYWHPQYRSWFYYDSGCSCYYYWCQPAGCYYPVTYCPCNTYSFPRTNTDTNVNVNVNQNVNQVNGGTPPAVPVLPTPPMGKVGDY
jgi:hypothetical protein